MQLVNLSQVLKSVLNFVAVLGFHDLVIFEIGFCVTSIRESVKITFFANRCFKF